MAKQTDLDLHLGTDFVFRFPIVNEAETAAIDITDWTLSFMLKRSARDSDASALLTLTTPTAITITGTYNPVIATNTQRANVVILDTLTDDLKTGTVAWELKRMDTGFEAILAYGDMRLIRSVHHA